MVFNLLSIGTDFAEWFSSVWSVFSNNISIITLLDIIFVAFIIYTLLKILRKSQSIQIIKGLVFVFFIYILINIFQMDASKYIFSNIINNILIILVVIFSKEIRQMLENLGHKNIFDLFTKTSKNDEQTRETINNVCRACADMSDDKIGSLIIFQRKSYLGDIMSQSVNVDAIPTFELLKGIFFPKAALHDGAIIIKNNRVAAARCVVPLRNETQINDHVGTRHRAALDVSILSDAVAVVTSEETGIISVAYDGHLDRNLSEGELRDLLTRLLITQDDKSKTPKNRKKGDSKK